MPDGLSDAIARAILAGFDRHYGLFRYNAQQAKSRYERGDWHGIRRLASERIAFYDQRVREAVQRIRTEFGPALTDTSRDGLWHQVKLAYIPLLAEHLRPELAETFFNSVCCRILHRTYYHNDFIFVWPAVATDYLHTEPSAYRVYYPLTEGWESTVRAIVVDFGLACPFVDIERDLQWLQQALHEKVLDRLPLAIDLQVHVLRGLFFRNKGAYLIGRIVNDGEVTPFSVPILRDSQGRLFLDALLVGTERVEALFNFSRAYFMVDMDVPAAYVRFLKSLMPTKPEAEIYTMLGLAKQGKALFYRDLLLHLHTSHDQFILAPGIKGMVMLVFTLPSFPYVFKLIRDKRGKDVSAEHIRDRYQLVKFHDRVGRMADTWEYSDVLFSRSRIDAKLMQELRDSAPSALEEEGDALVLRHLYIERRMTPLNLYLERADDVEREQAIVEYGQAIKEMVAANIFPGDMLYKNFGVSRSGRVVFYDYDEIAYLTDCNFRKVPEPRTPEEEMASEPWYPVGPHDVFPEEFGTFLLGDARVRKAFMAHHKELLDPGFWQRRQERIHAGLLDNVFPYPDALRFRHRRGAPSAHASASDAAPPRESHADDLTTSRVNSSERSFS